MRRDIALGGERGIVTASQLGEMHGFGQWATSSPYNVWKTYMGMEKEVPTPEMEERFRMGHWLEGFVAQHLTELYPEAARVERPKLAYVPKAWPWFGCHPDIIAHHRDGYAFPVEVKMSSVHNNGKWGEPETDEIPYEYLYQCFGYFAAGVPNKGYMWLLRFTDGKVTRYVVRRPADKLLRGIMGETRQILDGWDRGEVPSPATSDEAMRRWPDPEGSQEADLAIVQKVETLRAKQGRVKELTAEIDRLKAEVIDAMQGASTLVHEGQKLCTYTVQAQTRIDSKALKAEMPDVYGRFAKTIETRVFR